MSASGGGEQRLTDADVDASTPEGLFFQIEPAWSPDGSTIAFASKRSGNVRPLRDERGRERDAAADLDEGGRRPAGLVARRQADRLRPGRPGRLFVMDADGSGARRVTDEEVDETEPAWSPDGRWIAYVRESARARASASSGSCGPDGSQRRRLTKLGGVAQGPAWSPDGRRIAFSANVDDKRLRHLHGRRRRQGRAPRDVGRGLVRAGLVARRQDDRLLGRRGDRRDRRRERRRARCSPTRRTTTRARPGGPAPRRGRTDAGDRPRGE